MDKVAVPHGSASTLRSRLTIVNGRLDALLVDLERVRQRLRDRRYTDLQHADQARRAGRHAARSWWQGSASGLETAIDELDQLQACARALAAGPLPPQRWEGEDA